VRDDDPEDNMASLAASADLPRTRRCRPP
jgi:hypothetical protein